MKKITKKQYKYFDDIKHIGDNSKQDVNDHFVEVNKLIKQIEKEHMKKLKEKARKNKLILDE